MGSNRILSIIMSLIVVLTIVITPLTVATAEGDADPSGSDVSGLDVSGSEVSSSDVSVSQTSGTDVSETSSTTEKKITTTKKKTTTTEKGTTTTKKAATSQKKTGTSDKRATLAETTLTNVKVTKAVHQTPTVSESAVENKLTSLSIKTADGNELLKGFLPDVHAYTVTVPVGTNTLDITPTYSEQSDVEIKGADDLEANNYTVTVTLKNPDGTSEVYTINIVGAVPASSVKEDSEGFMKVIIGIIIASAVALVAIIIFGIVSIVRNKRLSNTTHYNFNFGGGEASSEDFTDRKFSGTYTGIDFSNTGSGLNYDFIEKMAENYEPISTTGPINAPREDTKPLMEMNPNVERVEFVADKPGIKLPEEHAEPINSDTDIPDELPIEFSAPTPIINLDQTDDIANAGFEPIPTDIPIINVSEQSASPLAEESSEEQPIVEEVPIQPLVEEQISPEDQIHLNLNSTMADLPSEPVLDLPSEPFAGAYVEEIESTSPIGFTASVVDPTQKSEMISELEPISDSEPIAEPESTPEPEQIAEPEPISDSEPIAEPESTPEPEQIAEPEPISNSEPQFQDYAFHLPYEAGKTLGRNPFEQSADD